MTERIASRHAGGTDPAPNHVGTLIQHWRRARRKSQLALAYDADVSPRHVCFLETGRARPSRAMLLQLAQVLDIPLRERNALLLAAGFAPLYQEADWDAPELAPVRLAVDSILRHQEPYPAVVMNRRWDIVTSNAAASRVFARFLGAPEQPQPLNVLRLMFSPTGLRPSVTNWEAVGHALVRRVHREALGGVPDEATTKLLAEVLAYPGVPAQWRAPDFDTPLTPVPPVSFAAADLELHYFSAITTLGTPQDVTLQEMRIESFFPADAQTAERSRQLADEAR